MKSLNPYAYYDCLSIGTKLQLALGSVAEAELHLFSYLACLLSLYRGKPASEWGYLFAGTDVGLPFSPEIAEVVPILLNQSYFQEQERLLTIGADGTHQFKLLSSLAFNANREPYLSGACSSVLAIPIGAVRSALRNAPELRAISALSSERLLLEESSPALEALYEQFSTLSASIGVDVNNLMIPAVVWLSYLAQEPEAVGGEQSR